MFSSFHSISSKTSDLNLVIEHLAPISQQGSKIHSSPSNLPENANVFLPPLSVENHIQITLQKAGICDQFANPTQKYQSLNFHELTFSSEIGRKCIKKILTFLQEKRSLESTRVSAEKKEHQLMISFTFDTLLKYLIQLSYCPRSSWMYEPQAIPIQEISLIGSYALSVLEIPLRAAAEEFFGSEVSKNQIRHWFAMKHVKDLFNKEFNDYDFRILSAGNLDYQAYLSNCSLHYFVTSIQNDFPIHLYIDQLKQKNEKKYQFDQQSFQQIDDANLQLKIKELSVLEFGGIKKRKLVDQEKTSYAVLGIKPIHDKPTDFLFVGLKNQQPTLENLNLSTSNCLTISIYHLLINQSRKHGQLTIDSQPFTAAKVLIDMLCGISTVTIPNVDAWRRFLRGCERSMQPIEHHEKKMVQSVFAYKKEYLENMHKLSNLRLQCPGSKNSDGYYLFYLLSEEILKSQVDPNTKQINPCSVISFLFRACQSLHNHSSIKDQELTTLWQAAEMAKWITVDSQKDAAIFAAIKDALLVDHIPFSVLSAWMGILTWVWNPYTATSHCQQPMFHLKTPLLCLLPIKPIEQCQVVSDYLVKHPCPSSFQKLYEVMAINNKACITSFPLLAYLPKLKIDPAQLKQFGELWMDHSASALRATGLHISLAMSSILPEKPLLAKIFQKIPKLLKQMVHPQQTQEFLTAVNTLASFASPGYSQAIVPLVNQKISTIKSQEWITSLIITHDPELLMIAYLIWKESYSPHQDHLHETSWKLFKSLCSHHPRLALSVLQRLSSIQKANKPSETFPPIIQLIRSYQMHAPQQLSGDIDRVLSLMYGFFEQEMTYQSGEEIQKKRFSQIFSYFVETLFQQQSYQATGDHFLLVASRKKYLDRKWQNERWLSRLEALAERPSQAHYAVSLYQIALQENFIDTTPPNNVRIQKLRIALGESLLLNQENPLSIEMLQQLYQEDIKPEAVRPFYQWALHVMQSQNLVPIENCAVNILEILLAATPPYKHEETHHAFFQFFQYVVKSFKDTSS